MLFRSRATYLCAESQLSVEKKATCVHIAAYVLKASGVYCESLLRGKSKQVVCQEPIEGQEQTSCALSATYVQTAS